MNSTSRGAASAGTAQRIVAYALKLIALMMAVYQLLYPFLLPWGQNRHVITHVTFALTLVFLGQLGGAASKQRKWLALVAFVITLGALPYTFANAAMLEAKLGIGLSTTELIVGIATFLVVLSATWLEWGNVLVALLLLGLTYFYLGYHIPGLLQGTKQPSFAYGLTFLITGISTGLFGQVTPISANLIFLFLLFAGVMRSTGATSMFVELGRALGQKMKGGVPLAAVVSSSLMGTITGSTIANAAFMGSLTIPAMKQQGIHGEDAAAIESAASCGGQLLPPVMGAGAFLMASYLGVPYLAIVKLAIVPALMYYVALMIRVGAVVRSTGFKSQDEVINWKLIVRAFPAFVVPLGIFVYLLLTGISAHLAIVYALFAIFVIRFARIEVYRSRKGFLQAVREIVTGLIEGAYEGAKIAIVICAISIFAQVLISSALAPKLTEAFTAFASGSALIGLALAMVSCILLGFGMPTVVSYSVVAIMFVPTLFQLGVPMPAAHLFVFYFAVFADLTPPVATAIIVTSKIAGSNFWRTGWASVKFWLAVALVPWLFVFHHAVLNIDSGGALLLPVAVFVGTSALIAALSERFLIVKMTPLDILLGALALLGGILWIVKVADAIWGLCFASIAVLALLVGQLKRVTHQAKMEVS